MKETRNLFSNTQPVSMCVCVLCIFDGIRRHDHVLPSIYACGWRACWERFEHGRYCPVCRHFISRHQHVLFTHTKHMSFGMYSTGMVEIVTASKPPAADKLLRIIGFFFFFSFVWPFTLIDCPRPFEWHCSRHAYASGFIQKQIYRNRRPLAHLYGQWEHCEFKTLINGPLAHVYIWLFERKWIHWVWPLIRLNE